MPLDFDKAPKAGDRLTTDDLEMIFEAVKKRQENFPEEAAGISFWMVLSGIGERFRRIECIEQEWSGFRKDVELDKEKLTCPNGHDLVEGPGIAVGWVSAE